MNDPHSTQPDARPWLRLVARVLMLAQAIYPIAGIAPAHAQAQAALTPSTAARAGQRPIIDAARNGVPIVHIAPPSQAGVSRNQYEQLNVGANGLILNNSSTNVQSQLGGWITGNMQLGPTPARIILNEVVSTGAGSGASQLKGFIEVAGQRADIVIANPNGISCDGCGFLNTNGRATLTTGLPRIGQGGDLSGFDVGTGQVRIGSGGLNATNLEQLDLIARGLVIEGEVWATNLRAVTGVNQVLYGTMGATPQTGTAAAPSFAIDIKELGGMYANAIYIVATEQGLGVNSTGRIAALQGNLSLSANGDLALKDTFAKQAMQLAGNGNTTLGGVTQSEAGMQIRSAGVLAQHGVVASGGSLDIAAAHLENSGTLYSAAALNIAAARVGDTNGKVMAAGELNIAAQGIALSGTQLSTDAKLTLAASAGDVSLVNAQVYAAGDIAASASGRFASSGSLVQSGRGIAVRAGAVANTGGTLHANGALQVTTPGAIDNTGGQLTGTAAVELNAASLANKANGARQALVASDQATRITTTGANAAGQGIGNAGGVLSGKTELVVATNGHALDNAGGTLVSDNALRIDTGRLGNADGRIVSRALRDPAAALTISAASLDNAGGEIASAAALTLDTNGQALTNDAGRITAMGALELRTGALTNAAAALIAGNGTLGIRATSLNNRGSTISSTGDIALDLGTGALDNSGGNIASATQLDLIAGSVDNTAGRLVANRGLAARVATLDNIGGVVSAADTLRIDSRGALVNTDGELSSNGTVHLTGSRLDNTRGSVSASATDLRLGSGELLNAQGRILGAQALALQSGAIVNAGGLFATDASLTIAIGGHAFDNAGGTLQVGGALTIAAARLDNTAGRIATGTSLLLDATAVDNQRGQLVSDGTLAIVASGLDNTRGTISANTTDLRLGTGTLTNREGELVGMQSLALQSGAIANALGTIVTGSALTLNTGGRNLDNGGGTIQAGAALTIGAGTLDNRGGKLIGGTALRIDSRSLVNDAGRIVAEGLLTLRSGDVANGSAALISSGADLDIAVTQLDTSGGTVQAGRDLRLATSATLINRAGTVAAGRDITARAGSLNNDSGSITSARALGLDAGRLSNQAGLISGTSGVRIASLALDNRGGELSSAAALIVDTQGETLDNTGGRIASQGALDVRAGAIRNDAGERAASIAGNTTLTLRAGSLSNRASSIGGVGAVSIDLGSGTLDNAGGSLTSGSGLSLTAGALGNQGGQIVADQSVSATVASLDNADGLVSAVNAVTLASAGGLDNSRGRITSDGAIGVTATGLVNTQGTISAQNAGVRLGTGVFDNHLGTLVGTQALTLQSGAIANTRGVIATGAALALDTAWQDLDNTGGTVQAGGALGLNTARLDNTGGTLSSAGSIGIASQSFVNGSGRVVAGSDLGVQSSSLDNNAGRIVAGQALTLTTRGGSLVNDAGTITAAQGLALDAGTLSNRGGLIESAGDSRIGSQALDNSGGDISSRAAQSLDTHGQSLVNTGGRITAEGALDLRAGTIANDASATQAAMIAANGALALQAASLSNRGSSITSVGDAGIALGAGALDNTGGTVSSAGSLSLNAGAVTNTAVANAGGVISAEGTLHATLASFDNTRGQFVAGGSSALVTSGALVNDRGRIATNAGLALTAASLDNRAGQIGAAQIATLDVGVGASGTLNNDRGAIRADALSVRSGALSNAGGLIASNTTLVLNANGQSLNNAGGTIQAITGADINAGQTHNAGGRVLAGQSLALTTLALDNTTGEIASGGSASITTQGQGLVNDAGRLTADTDLALSAGALGNAQAGVIAANRDATLNTTSLTNSGSLQAGRDLRVVAGGDAVNSGSLNAQRHLTLQSAGLNNSAGLLAANGDVSIATGAASNQGGNVQAAGSLGFSATSLDNRSGQIVGAGNSTLGLGNGSLDNDGGTIASAQALGLTAGATRNRFGQIVGGSDLVASTQALDNSGGVIGSQATLTLSSHAFTNTGGTLQAQGDLSLNAAAVGNTGGGRILANRGATIAASSLDNTGSTISAGAQLSIDAGGALANGQGRITAGTTASVSAGSLSGNAQGLISAAQTLNIDTATGALDNAGGTLVAALGVQIASGALDNRAGTIASTQGALSVDTRGRSLVNDGGALQAFGNATLSSGALGNQAGLISGLAVNLGTAGLDNDGGSIVAKGALGVDAQALSNRAGLLQSATALSIDTHGGDLVNTGSGPNAGISAGGTLGIRAGRLDNRTGVIVSSGDQTLALGGDLDNRGGLVSSSGTLGINATNSLVDNRNGRIVAGGDLVLAAASLVNSGAGTSIAAANIDVTTATLDNSAGGSVVARTDARITAANLDNTGGSLSAKGQLTVHATQLANAGGEIVGDGGVSVSTASTAPGGSIASANNVALNIAGDYDNTGLLSARGSLSITAANIGNSGTLRAEQALALSAGNLVNSGEISSRSTTIAASGRVTNSGLIDGTLTRVTAGTLANTGRIYGDALAIGGGTVDNSGSGVIAARDSLRLGATVLNNTGGGLVYAIGDIAIGGSLTAQGQVQGAMQTLLNASSTIEAGRDLSVSAVALTNRNDGLTTTQVTGPTTALPVLLQPSGWAERYPLSRFLGYGDHTVHFIVHPNLYGLRSVMQPAMVSVAEGCIELNDSGGFCWPARTDYNYPWNSPVFAQFGVIPPTADSATWDVAYAALNVQIYAYNAVVNEDNRTVAFEDYTLYTLTSTSSSTQVLSSAPGKLLAGRDLTLAGAVKSNLDSQIVAGRNLFVSGASVDNIATKGTTTTTVSGTAQFSHVDSCGTFGGSHCRRTDGAVAYQPAPETTHPDLPTVVYLSNAAGAAGTRSLAGSGTSADARSAGNAAAASGSLAQTGRSIDATIGGAQSAHQAGRSSDGAGTGDNVQGSGVGTQTLAAQATSTAAVPATVIRGASAGTPLAERPSAGANGVAPEHVSIGSVVRPGRHADTVSAVSAVASRGAGLGVVTATVAASARLAPPLVQRVNASGTGERALDVILTVLPRLALPTSSLFRINAAPGAKYLVETDPRFTNGRAFLGSDYFFAQLQLDPERTLARYGDGFEEQRLLDDQVLALTGRRYLSGYTNTQDEYAALMNAGVAFARQYQLSPGVALSAEQMTLLTTDIVWLTTQTVALPDGSTAQVLVPELYIRRPQADDLSASGALMAGGNVFIQTTGDLANKGAILGDSITLAAGNDLVNEGTVRGQDVYARAERDLLNLGGSFIGSGDGSGNTGTLAFSAGRDIVLQTTTQTSQNAQSTRTSVDRIATVQGGNVTFEAARDFIAQGASVGAAGDLQANAGRNIAISAVEGSYRLSLTQLTGDATTQGRTGYLAEAQTTQQQSTFNAGNNLSLVAQGDVAARGSSLAAANDAFIRGANVTIEAAKASQSIDIQTVQKRSYDRAAKSDETLVGGVIAAGNNLSLAATGNGVAGQGDLILQGATLPAKGQALLTANNDIRVLDASTAHSSSQESHRLDKGLLKSTATTNSAQSTSTLSQGTTITGALTALVAGRDLGIQGSSVSGTDGVLMSAGRNLVITEGRSTSEQTSSADKKTTGLAGSFMGVPLPLGARDKLVETLDTASVAASSVRSSAGSVSITGGGTTALSGVQVEARQGIAIQGAEVVITGATGSQQQTDQRDTRGTNIGMTGWHDIGKGLDARRTETFTSAGTGLTRTTLSGSSVSITATGANGASGDITLSGTTVNAASLTTDAANTLRLNLQSTTQTNDKSTQGGDVAWQAMTSLGQSAETAQYNQFNVATFTHTEKSIEVQVGQKPVAPPAAVVPKMPGAGLPAEPPPDPKAALQSTVASLAAQPGMAWMRQLQSDPTLQGKIDWNAVSLAHERWDHEAQGLTPAAAIVITLVVAYFTAGAASGVGQAAAVGVGEGVALTSGGAFLTSTGTVISGAVTAGVGALASQAAVALLNNKGDVGKALHDLGSSANVKGLVSAVLTGGVLAGLSLNPTGAPTEGAGASKFMVQLQQNLQAGAAKAVINTAIYGNSLEDNLKREIKGALISTATAQTANAIGDAKFDSVTNKLAHAIAGCAAGAASTGNSSGCSAGALGAAVGEISAELYGRQADPNDTVRFASMVSGIAAAVAGQDVSVASAAGGNAAANNYLNHDQWAAYSRQRQACVDESCRKQLDAVYSNLSAMQDTALATCDKRGDCAALQQQVTEGRTAQIALIQAGQLLIGLAGAADLQSYGEKLAGDPALRAQVGQAVTRHYECEANPGQCTQDALLAAGGLAAVVTGGAVVVGLVQAAPAIAAAAKLTLDACLANFVLCANHAGIVGMDVVAGDALGGAAIAGATVVGATRAVNTIGEAANATLVARAAARTSTERSALAQTLNNFYRDGAPPELIQQMLSQASISSTHNGNAAEVVLGKYIAGSLDSYESIAQARGSTYFSMSDWSTVQGQLGADQMWSINRTFLDQQITLGKSFVFTVDPRRAPTNSFTFQEYEHLRSQGYVIEQSLGGFYRATKK